MELPSGFAGEVDEGSNRISERGEIGGVDVSILVLGNDTPFPNRTCNCQVDLPSEISWASKPPQELAPVYVLDEEYVKDE